MFSSDRDLLLLEPNLFRDLGWSSQRLLQGTAAIADGVLTLSAEDNDFEEAGIGQGHVAVVDGTAYEVLERLSPTTVALSRPRAAITDPPLPPSPVASKPVFVSTFRPQLAISHSVILRMLGIDPSDPAVPGRITEDEITNPASLTLAESLHALATIYHAACLGSASGPAWSLWQRAQSYRDRFESERQRAAARIDLDGDGLPDATRRLNVIQLLRA
jgi:hypothetical protein